MTELRLEISQFQIDMVQEKQQIKCGQTILQHIYTIIGDFPISMKKLKNMKKILHMIQANIIKIEKMKEVLYIIT